MNVPRSEEGARTIATSMNRAIVSKSHPVTRAYPWLEEHFSRFGSGDGSLLDIATGTGRTLIKLLSQYGGIFTGTVYAVEAQPYMAQQLVINFDSVPCFRNVNLVPLVMPASELIEKPRVDTIGIDGRLQPIDNPFYEARTKVQRVVTTEFWHEAFSCPALEACSLKAGQTAYDRTIDALAAVLQKDGLMFFQDLHGPEPNMRMTHRYSGENASVALHAVNWIINPEYEVPAEFLLPSMKQEDDSYWTPERRSLLTDIVTERTDYSAKSVSAKVLTEAAYRIVEKDVGGKLITVVDRDHEIHTAKARHRLENDFDKRNLWLALGMSVIDDYARPFFVDAGIEIQNKAIPAIYSVGMFIKQ